MAHIIAHCYEGTVPHFHTLSHLILTPFIDMSTSSSTHLLVTPCQLRMPLCSITLAQFFRDKLSLISTVCPQCQGYVLPIQAVVSFVAYVILMDWPCNKHKRLRCSLACKEPYDMIIHYSLSWLLPHPSSSSGLPLVQSPKLFQSSCKVVDPT